MRSAREWRPDPGRGKEQDMAGDQSLWRLALLSAVYLIDLMVFIGLCRDELRAWRRRERQAKPIASPRRSDSAAMAR
jgi:hypothetical protein